MKFPRKVFLMLFIALFITSTFAMEVKAPPATWSVQYMIDQSQTVGGYSQFADPRNTRGLALSPDGRYLYVGYNNPNGVNINKHDKQVRKIDTTVSDYTDATVAILQGDRGKAIATDDKGRVYLAEGSDTDTKDGKGIHIYNAALSTKLWTISSLTKPEGVAATRESGALFLYATDRSAKTLTKFAITEGSGVSITNVAVQWSISVAGASDLRGVEVDPNGKIWMADNGGNNVFRVNNDGSSLTSTTVTKAMDISFGYGNAYVTQYTARTITVLKQDDLSYVETLTPPWADLELDADGQSGIGALSGIAVRESSGVLYVANEAGQTADEHSTYGRTDSESGDIGTEFYTDMTHDDNDPILKMASPMPPVGGEWIPIDRLQLLVPWISVIAFLVIATTSFVYVRRKRTQLN
jgi:DNA-binding beta-propeller fold protein YncE